MNKELIKKITEKKEFSQLPKKDVEKAFAQFDKERYVDSEKIKLTRDLLRKIYSAFASQKLLSLKDKSPEWILRKHLSTRERLPYYLEVYGKVLAGLNKDLSVIDLGAGINGFSYEFFKKSEFNVDYVGVEAMGQLVDLMNHYFNIPITKRLREGMSKSKVKGKAIHLSLFELEKIKQEIKKAKKPSVVFLFKTLDSLEMLEPDYSKKLLLEITPFVERVVVSFATKSMIKGTRFKANRKWLIDFIKDTFNLIDDFELGGERYIVFEKN